MHISVLNSSPLNLSLLHQPPFTCHSKRFTSPNSAPSLQELLPKIFFVSGGIRPNPTNPLDPPLIFHEAKVRLLLSQCNELTRLNERLDELDARQQRQLLELLEAVDTSRSQRSPCISVRPSYDDQRQQQEQLERVESVVSQRHEHGSAIYCSRYSQP